MRKFKVGDRVNVAGIEICRKQSCFNKKMEKWCGKTVTIDGFCGMGYLIKEDHGECVGQEHDGWRWGDGMFSGLAKSSAASIHITTDGKTTHAVLKDGGKVTRRAKTVCSPDDEFDFATGARIALDRLMGTGATGTVREVQRQAKVGDMIKITSGTASGVIGEVIAVDAKGIPLVRHPKAWGIGVDKNGMETTRFSKSAYLILEGYTHPKKPDKPKYYNGKVVCVESSDAFTVGKVYTFVDGRVMDDDGDERPAGDNPPITALDDYFMKDITHKFIEFKGDAK